MMIHWTLLSLINKVIFKFYGKLSWASTDVVPQERRRTVNPLRGKTEFLANETIKVNPNGVIKEGINEKEYPVIANNQSDTNGRQIELVPRRPRGNSNNDPSGSNSEVRAKAKRNPWRESPFEFHAQVRSERAPVSEKTFYVGYDFYVEPSQSKKGITPKRWPENFAPAG